jgi:hypothetical protein
MGQEKLNVFYDLEVLAKSLKLASIDIINTSKSDIESHWYRSAGPVDLFYWKDKNRIVKHQINLYGQVVEWNIFDGLKTGFVRDEDMAEEIESHEVVQFDNIPNPHVLKKATEFIDLATGIEADVRQKMAEHYGDFQEQSPIRRFFSKFIKLFSK